MSWRKIEWLCHQIRHSCHKVTHQECAPACIWLANTAPSKVWCSSVHISFPVSTKWYIHLKHCTIITQCILATQRHRMCLLPCADKITHVVIRSYSWCEAESSITVFANHRTQNSQLLPFRSAVLPFNLPEAECSLQPGEHIYKHKTRAKRVGTPQTKMPPAKAFFYVLLYCCWLKKKIAANLI